MFDFTLRLLERCSRDKVKSSKWWSFSKNHFFSKYSLYFLTFFGTYTWRCVPFEREYHFFSFSHTRAQFSASKRAVRIIDICAGVGNRVDNLKNWVQWEFWATWWPVYEPDQSKQTQEKKRGIKLKWWDRGDTVVQHGLH